MRKIGKCKLCHAEKELCLSHLLPAAFYKRLRDHSSANPNPVIINNKYGGQSSLQVRDYLLCEKCERLLSDKGEQYVIVSAFDGQKFPLQAALKKLTPAVTGPKIRAVSCAGVPSVDIDKLAYFASSVFWRASAHEWHAKGGITISIHLGRGYEEVFRAFILGGSGFPCKAAIWWLCRRILIHSPRFTSLAGEDELVIIATGSRCQVSSFSFLSEITSPITFAECAPSHPSTDSYTSLIR